MGAASTITKTIKRPCRECGVPWLISFILRWNDNGTISMYMAHDFRAVILHQGFMDALFSKIEARLGLSIEHIAFEALRNAGKATFDSTFDGVTGARFCLRFGTSKRFAVEYFNTVAITCGQCHSETLEYVPGRLGVARQKNPFHMSLMAAYVVGAFEAMEGCPFKAVWEEVEKDTYIVRVEATGEKPEIAERLRLKIPSLLPGSIKHESCPKCRAPRALAHLKWSLDEGIIIDTRTDSRVLLLDGHAINSVFREMTGELGDEVDQLLIDAQREWTVDHVGLLGLSPAAEPLPRDKLEEAYIDYLSMLPLHGQGNPISFKMEGPNIEVVVENPYNDFILAGTLQGLYEALEKTDSKVQSREERPGAAYFKVGPV